MKLLNFIRTSKQGWVVYFFSFDCKQISHNSYIILPNNLWRNFSCRSSIFIINLLCINANIIWQRRIVYKDSLRASVCILIWKRIAYFVLIKRDRKYRHDTRGIRAFVRRSIAHRLYPTNVIVAHTWPNSEFPAPSGNCGGNFILTRAYAAHASRCSLHCASA